MAESPNDEQQQLASTTQVPTITGSCTNSLDGATLCADSNGLPMPVLRVEQLKEEGCSSTYTSEEESDSEVLSRLGEFVPPDDEMAKKIIAQIEFYFSDANIVKDAFLLKHVRRNKYGYVNLKLITSFKKMKALTKDFRVVAHAVRAFSSQLAISDEGNKVRRIAPLPDYDETTPSRTVVAINLPYDNPTVESVADLFRDCGEIALVRILRPGKPMPPDVRKQLSKHPEASSATVALVEFERHEGAAKACAKVASDSSRSDWRTGLRVAPLVVATASSSPGRQQKKKEPCGDEDSGGEFDRKATPSRKTHGKKGGPASRDAVAAAVAAQFVVDGFSSGSEGDFTPRSRGSSFGSEPSRSRGNSLGSRASATTTLSPNAQRRRSSNPHGTSPLAAGTSEEKRSSPRPSPGGSPEARRRNSSGGVLPNGDASLSGVEAPPTGTAQWMQRRMLSGREISPLAKSTPTGVSNSGGSSPLAARKMAREDILIRLPKGPDGTGGFHRNGDALVSRGSPAGLEQ